MCLFFVVIIEKKHYNENITLIVLRIHFNKESNKTKVLLTIFGTIKCSIKVLSTRLHSILHYIEYLLSYSTPINRDSIIHISIKSYEIYEHSIQFLGASGSGPQTIKIQAIQTNPNTGAKQIVAIPISSGPNTQTITVNPAGNMSMGGNR